MLYRGCHGAEENFIKLKPRHNRPDRKKHKALVHALGCKVGRTLIICKKKKNRSTLLEVLTSGVGVVHENGQWALVVVQDVLLKRVVVRVGPGVVVDVGVGVDLFQNIQKEINLLNEFATSS